MANTAELRRTWFVRAYGPAADEMTAVYAQIEAAWKRDTTPRRCSTRWPAT